MMKTCEKSKIKQNIAQIIYIKNSYLKSTMFLIFSIIYNMIIIGISLVGLVPFIIHTVNPQFNDTKMITYFYSFIILFCCIYLLDYFLRLLTIDIYYECNYKKAAIKQIFSFSNFQFLSAISVIIIVIIFFKTDLISIDVSMFVVTLLFLFNAATFFTRIMLKESNVENFKLVKRIIYSKRKSIAITIAVMFIAWIVFSYLVFIVEHNNNSNVNSIFDAMYFCFIAMTTVGFGDIVPKTTPGRTISVFLAIFGVSFYAYVGSVFVNIYIEYINKKKQIRHEIIDQKTKENEQKKFLMEINNLILKNLYDAGVIKKKKYDELLSSNNLTNKIKKINYSFEDFIFDKNDKKVFLNDNELGLINTNKDVIKNAYNQKWLALMDKPDNDNEISAALYSIPVKFIEKVKTTSMPIFFSTNFIDENIQKIIFFRKQGIKSAFLEINLYTSISLEKESAWVLYGGYTNLSKNKFDSLFKKVDKINVMLIKDIIIYDQLKPLESFGINPNTKVADIIYLK